MNASKILRLLLPLVVLVPTIQPTSGRPSVIDLWTSGKFSTAIAINERNQVVISGNNLDGETRAYIWNDGVLEDLGTLGARNI